MFAKNLASPFGHLTQVSTQVQLASTCDYSAGSFDQGFKKGNGEKIPNFGSCACTK